MTCEDFMDAFVAGRPGAFSANDIEEHARGCEECRTFREEHASTLEALDSLSPAAPLSEERKRATLGDMLLIAAARRDAVAAVPRARPRRALLAAAVATAFLLGGLAGGALRGSHDREARPRRLEEDTGAPRGPEASQHVDHRLERVLACYREIEADAPGELARDAFLGEATCHLVRGENEEAANAASRVLADPSSGEDQKRRAKELLAEARGAK